ncbi:type II toxin-antitoxin system RelE/ParE family toxin [Vibrio alginolyticus]|uniref:type II toxin-antitoxin system RelE/ParE family toxin n=1 Tax=Vibrio TaxID=662 RepID=UPI00045F3110|nr:MULTISPECIES: type II toxin-antitoxin system RelE/ParE family toxin [Vibrio]MCC9652525.1 type II toxin-antitoxin system RelE/ParE family toxin [Vibrio sp. MA64]MDG2625288.1 type II toxin-antitoxin system RelE/ParE family toxin [Vibrio parahaemolyticus]MDW1970055.1 type II toxin-antitoxin system RelE/ParE family toxin [Vibrio sp. 945]MDW2260414.1 type II toxin-antitoxin system RelE/ParE family toxin [Vibrio sp. 1409]GAK16027.1 ParE toxin protein [Vibrio sp. JCM 19053]
MHTLTANDAKQNFDELLLSAQREPVKISKNSKDTLLSGFQMLADNPDLGRSCDEMYPNGFYFPIGKHTAYFTKEDNFILVVAVLGQSQLPQNHLK